MKQKRFVYGRVVALNSDDSLPCITDCQDGKDYVRMSDVADLLNNINDENGELKKDMKRLERNHQNLHERYEEMEQKYKEYYRKYDRIINNTGSAKRVYLNLKECFEDE